MTYEDATPQGQSPIGDKFFFIWERDSARDREPTIGGIAD